MCASVGSTSNALIIFFKAPRWSIANALITPSFVDKRSIAAFFPLVSVSIVFLPVLLYLYSWIVTPFTTRFTVPVGDGVSGLFATLTEVNSATVWATMI